MMNPAQEDSSPKEADDSNSIASKSHAAFAKHYARKATFQPHQLANPSPFLKSANFFVI
ncbi:MAG: hypothetical protein KH142_00525 [Slackia piriformis]|uniref:Uncharacterized protein n=1 Tax=Slackia piriformis TaxID=626934 RepID=A0A943YUS5_9ACTN|nr:hypothetical protein [Slackia piriformis]